ncbi:uroporphyrinogen-III synthase [Pelagibacterales bacterium SAG-MED17]|nr:uroporphyrinogen-III synthase [Pelagibacterales bacterium SAG-MED17]
MHILLTRPLEDSKELILRFSSLGHKVSHLPVIKVEPVKYDEPDYVQFKGVIFTSSNAIKNLDSNKIDKNIECYCVGFATEKAAKLKGFQNIISAEGNVNNLKELVLRNFDPKNGSLLYVSGEVVSSRLDKDLISEGYSLKRLTNYTVLPTQEIKEEFREELKASIPDIIYVYSENSAKSLLNLLKKYDLLDSWMDTNLMCMGEKASAILNEIKWKKIFLFNSGEEEFLLYKI